MTREPALPARLSPSPVSPLVAGLAAACPLVSAVAMPATLLVARSLPDGPDLPLTAPAPLALLALGGSVGAICAVLLWHAARGRRVPAALVPALAVLPWLVGGLAAAAALRDVQNLAAGPIPGFEYRVLGIYLSLGLLAGSALGLTVAALAQGAPGRRLAGPALVVASALPLLVAGAAGAARSDLGWSGLLLLTNPLVALLPLGLAAFALGAEGPDGRATPLALSVPVACALGFLAVLTLISIEISGQAIRAFSSVAGGASAELVGAARADVARVERLRVAGGLLALLPFAALLFCAYLSLGRRLPRPGPVLAPLAVAGLVVAAEAVASARIERPLVALAARAAGDPAVAPGGVEPGSGVSAPELVGVVGGPSELPPGTGAAVGEGVPGGVVGGVEGAAPSGVGAVPQPPAEPAGEGGATSPATILFRAPPEYPAEARASGVAGTVAIQVTIGRDGSVERATALSGPQALREAALASVRRWRYRPAMRDGSAVSSQRIEIVNFAAP